MEIGPGAVVEVMVVDIIVLEMEVTEFLFPKENASSGIGDGREWVYQAAVRPPSPEGVESAKTSQSVGSLCRFTSLPR
jgi:hypothetical protein